MKSHSLLSVVIPVYNVKDYLHRCVKSVCEQTYQNIEIILVDDGSTDASGEMCDVYAAQDPRIKVVHKQNGGLVSARKTGLFHAVGKYAAYVDADDWIEKGMYKELVSMMDYTDADFVSSGMIREYEGHAVMQKEGILPGIYEKESITDHMLKRMIETETFFKSNIIFSAWNKIYKRNFLMKWQNQVDNFINVGEDIALSYPCMIHADKISVSDKCFYHYCMRDNSIMGSKRVDEFERYQVLFRDLIEECRKCRNRVPNIMDQLKLHIYYLMLLQYADRVIQYQNGFLFPFGKVNRTDRIVIYGAGRFGCEVKDLLERKYKCRIVAWVDKAKKDGIQSVNLLDSLLYDIIIIAVLIADIADEIKRELLGRGVNKEKIRMINPEFMKMTEKGMQQFEQKIRI
ncbi:MAG: glycosyltransferase [Eubacterium sp.]|nr:glycosyltransferase [Eubacterium sp.]